MARSKLTELFDNARALADRSRNSGNAPNQGVRIVNKHFAHFCQTAALSVVLALSSSGIVHADGNSMMVAESGIIKVKSAYSKADTIARLKQDIAAKGIRFFDEIDQAKLAADAGIQIRPSALLVFGNPPLGTLFIRSNSLAGLDWPVRLLVRSSLPIGLVRVAEA